MLPDYPQTAGHCPHELYPTPCHSRGLSARGHNTSFSPYDTNPTPLTALSARDFPGDHDCMDAYSSQRTIAGMSWTAPYVTTEGGAAVAEAEGLLNCSASRERASMRPESERAGEKAHRGPHHLTPPERLTDHESRATGRCGCVGMCGSARHLRSLRPRPSRTDISPEEGRLE